MVKRARARDPGVYPQLRVILLLYVTGRPYYICPPYQYSGPNASRGLFERRRTERHITLSYTVDSGVFIHPLCKQTCK